MVNVGSNCGHICTVRKVLGVCGSIIADVLRCPVAQERMLDTGALGGMKVDEAFVNAFFLDEI
jgi:hypothetical protein